MRQVFAVVIALVAAAGLTRARSSDLAQTPAPPPLVKLAKASLAAEVTNNQKTVLVPPAGQKFLLVKANVTQVPLTIDLTKVVVVSGADKWPLIGVDSDNSGDAKEFSMIAAARVKGGAMNPPLEQTHSIGFVAFAFTPGKVATLRVNDASFAVCLVFAVPETFKAGQLQGIGAQSVALPTLGAPGRQ